MSKAILEKLQMPSFSPLFGLKGLSHTIASYFFPYNPFINNSKQHVISLGDGDKIVVLENKPPVWVPSQRIILLVHGLTGSDQSKYFVRATKLFINHGYAVIRMNLRGCGAGKGFAQGLYHSGRSEDTRTVLKWLKNNYPNSPVTQIGYSLGANITLKMAGEGDLQGTNLDSIIALSPPLDLEASVNWTIKNRLFNDFFVKALINEINKLHDAFPTLPRPQLHGIKTLYEFDEYYTAPRNGFKNAHEYYTLSSSAQFIDNISLPTLMLYALDDPIVSQTKFLDLSPKSNIDLLLTQYGGHVGWLGKTDIPGNYRWMDRVIFKWTAHFDRS
ncbi:MAG: alpha/beta fold hydrolase [Proteobacteria bacterium]|nr:alpha/beta fold hydrolase [Pseudomonadota bacterium]